MSDTFQIDANIHAGRNDIPIRFAHHKTFDKPQNHVLHINNYIEFYVYISGNHNYVVSNSLYKLQEGDIIIINSREVHKALTLNETMYERFYFLIDENIFADMYFNPLASILSKLSKSENLVRFEADKKAEILSMLYQVSDCFRDGKDEQFRALSILMRLLDEINTRLTESGSESGNVAHTPDLLQKILSYMEQNLTTISSTSEIAHQFGITPQYLSNYFAKHIGTPPKAYIQAKRIAFAKTMLDKGADVTTACYESGFNDCSYFIRIFKKYVGQTPLGYKQALKK